MKGNKIANQEDNKKLSVPKENKNSTQCVANPNDLNPHHLRHKHYDSALTT